MYLGLIFWGYLLVKICRYQFFFVILQANSNCTTMKNTIFFFFCFVFGTMSAHNLPFYASTLQELDKQVENRHAIIHEREQSIEHLKSLWILSDDSQRGCIAEQIYKQYGNFNSDSALYYARVCRQYALATNNATLFQSSSIAEAQYLAINGMYDAAKEILDKLPPTLMDCNKNAFYKVSCLVYAWQSDYTTIPEEKEYFWKITTSYRQNIIDTETEPIWRAHENALILEETDTRQALDIVRSILDTLSIESDYVRYLANSAARFYKKLNQQDSALYYYAISAISDVRHGVLEHASLREVALLLYQNGDISRAYQYTNACLEDAQQCKARLRVIEMAGDLPIILNAYQERITQTQRRQSIMIVALCIFLIVFIVLFVYTFIIGKRLAVAHQNTQLALQQVNEANAHLQEANRIRSAYVTEYMSACSESIQTLDNYHQILLRTAVHENHQTLFNTIKSVKVLEDSLRKFYVRFDETFLGLFPNFVEQVNQLLCEDKAFAPVVNRHLSTELRILALIRLGITNSDDIARFLRHSPKTIFNYRGSIRNRAKENRDTLEQRIAELG